MGVFKKKYAVAMGTKLSPALATIYFALLEEAFLKATRFTPICTLDILMMCFQYGRMAGIN